MKIHYIQHVPFEGPGYIETWLKGKSMELQGTRFFEPGYKLPDINDIDALIIMGGPMGVHDYDKAEWLMEEKWFIKKCIREGKKVLGICLGAQLIADVMDTKVSKAKHKEIGWFPVSTTDECKQLPWFHELFKDEPIVFHWHGDQFEIPNGSLDLLTSEANANQAFYLNNNVIGLQFHLEVTQQSISEMLENGINELEDAPKIQTMEQIVEGEIHIQQCNRIMMRLLENWLRTY